MSDTTRSSAGTNWSAQGGSTNKPGQNTAKSVETLKDKVGDALDRGRSGLADSTSAAGDSLSEDVAKLREDMAAIQKTLSKFASEARGEAVKTAQNVSSAVASQVGEVAQQVGETASEYAAAASQQVKTFASEMETMARRESLGNDRRGGSGRRRDRDDVAGSRLMVATVLKLVGFDLQRQLARLKAQAEDFKDRTTDELKHKAVDAGLTIGLAFGGLIFIVLTVAIGLLALYLWIEVEHGPFAGLGAVALTTTALAALLFMIAIMRGKSDKPAAKRTTVDAGAAFSTAASLGNAPRFVTPQASFVELDHARSH